MKVLVVDDDQEIRDVLTFMLESQYQAIVYTASSGNQAKKILDETPNIGCIISDYSMDDGTGGDLFNYLLSVHSEIPFILCSTYPAAEYPEFTNHKIYGSIIKPDLVLPLETLIKALPEFSKKPTSAKQAYTRIKTSTVLKYGLLHSDLYLRLSDKKFVKVVQEGDTFDFTDFQKFAAKDVSYLYVPTEQSKSVLETMLKELKNIEVLKNIPEEITIEVSQNTYEVINDFNQSIGMTPEVVQMVKKGIQLTLKNIKKNNELRGLLDKLVLDPECYLSSHSIALANIACGVAAVMGWTSEVTFYKLALAAFLHDITLENHVLAKCSTLAELAAKRNWFTEKEIESYKTHPIDAAALVSKISDAPADVDLIIKQHHEMPNGSGFPSALDSRKIAPLSALFIVAHSIISFYFENAGKAELIDYINQLDNNYKVGQFGQIIRALTRSVVTNKI